MRKLTQKQARFIQEFVYGPHSGNATRAAVASGYAPKAATQAGSRLVRSVDVGKAIQEEEEARTEKLEQARDKGSAATAWLTSGWLLAKIRYVMDQALDAGNYAAANKSAELLGRYLRMWSDDESAKRSGPVLNVKRVEVYLDHGAGSPRVIDAKVLQARATSATDATTYATDAT
jgi:hypothetical protein